MLACVGSTLSGGTTMTNQVQRPTTVASIEAARLPGRDWRRSKYDLSPTDYSSNHVGHDMTWNPNDPGGGDSE